MVMAAAVEVVGLALLAELARPPLLFSGIE
jgi:hypothetical protein